MCTRRRERIVCCSMKERLDRVTLDVEIQISLSTEGLSTSGTHKFHWAGGAQVIFQSLCTFESLQASPAAHKGEDVGVAEISYIAVAGCI